ncbi:hypothetical protein [Desulforhopalus singaporensis]|uniref:Transposase n=1 Tax=Desulforhopalus singaporensis TaxID=91360 RepID=A0A1H0NAF2_9BACT|nr:hypothetical protein [Desulforhopalus singaporensis]SDO89641.1 hypothetical protein SAMN05660330_01319 [Desulforhopalus singaporensis]
MSKRTRRNYSEEFRDEAVKLITEHRKESKEKSDTRRCIQISLSDLAREKNMLSITKNGEVLPHSS